MQKNLKNKLIGNLLILAVSIGAAIILSRLGVFDVVLSQSTEIRFLGMFIAGLFYTSVLTVGPATLAIAEISSYNSIFLVAAIGALGAVIGDLAIFSFVKEKISGDVEALFKNSRAKRLVHLLKMEIFRWLTPFLGFLIVASPLPDEIGLAMMGLSKIKFPVFILLSYTANFFGILFLGGVFHSLIS